MDTATADQLLLGRDARTAARLTGVAGALLVAVFVVHLPARLVGPFSFTFGLSLPLLAALAFVVAVGGAYRNDGLLVCVALAAGVGYGFYLPLTLFDLVYPSETVLWALGAGAGFAVVVGATGFVVGAVARRLVERVRAGSA